MVICEYAQQLLDDKGNRLLSPEYDESKWAKASCCPLAKTLWSECI
ncbi:hypothetical protein NXW89_00045 [Bacteroides thetaiotaomicron]|nr:hypothetical protein [Bacteroides thetaiotaomicron]